MADFVMPSLGADMEAGVLVGWLRQPGETVKRGDIIAEVETDKGIIEIEVFRNGVIEEVLVQPGEKVPVGTVLARIREDAGQPSAETANVTDVAKAPKPQTGPITPTVSARPPEEADRIRMSPAARRLAHDLHVDPADVRGTGPSGAITREDVLAAADAAKRRQAPIAPTSIATKPRETAAEVRLRRMRQTIASAMSRSKREIPHYYLATTVDLHRATGWLTETNSARPVTDRLLMGVLFLKATALALKEVPELNSVWEGEHVALRTDIHVGVAISLRQGGLVAPAIHDTDRLSLDQLMGRLRDLTNRARSGGLRSSELSDSTITVTSMGERGVETVFGIIYPPQVALVGFGKLVERPWSIDGALISRPVVTVTLSADHRVSDGHRGGLFLNAIDRLLQEPEKL
ncbi:MAG: dihydrolipoamide acetyltransferase family protein [Planctomycetaceae bacterium]